MSAGPTIDKGVPVPAGRFSRPYSPLRVAMQSLGVGDSFLVPSGTPLSTAYSSAHRASKESGRVYTVRKTPEGPRCWRLA